MNYSIGDMVYYVCFGYKVGFGSIYKMEEGVSSGDIYYYVKDKDSGTRQNHIRFLKNALYIDKLSADNALEGQQPKRQELSAEEQLIQKQQMEKDYEEWKDKIAKQTPQAIVSYLRDDKFNLITRKATEEEIKLWEEVAKEEIKSQELGELPKILKLNSNKINYVYEQVSKEHIQEEQN